VYWCNVCVLKNWKLEVVVEILEERSCRSERADKMFLNKFRGGMSSFLVRFVVPELGEVRYGVTQNVEPGVR
jgi:hypothetical protein